MTTNKFTSKLISELLISHSFSQLLSVFGGEIERMKDLISKLVRADLFAAIEDSIRALELEDPNNRILQLNFALPKYTQALRRLEVARGQPLDAILAHFGKLVTFLMLAESTSARHESKLLKQALDRFDSTARQMVVDSEHVHLSNEFSSSDSILAELAAGFFLPVRGVILSAKTFVQRRKKYYIAIVRDMMEHFEVEEDEDFVFQNLIFTGMSDWLDSWPTACCIRGAIEYLDDNS